VSNLYNRAYSTDSGGSDSPLVMSDQDRYKLINGISFSATHSLTIVTAATTTGSVLITVPTAGSGIYTLVVEVDAKLGGTLTLSETPSVDVSGASVITAANLNRNSSNTSTLTLQGQVIQTTAGTVLETRHIGSISGPMIKTRPRRLLSSGVYLARFVADSATTACAFNLYFYRES